LEAAKETVAHNVKQHYGQTNANGNKQQRTLSLFIEQYIYNLITHKREITQFK